MKIFKRLILLITIIAPLTACDSEDGDINDWVGSYRWSSNVEEKWHQFITGERKKQNEVSYSWDEYKYNIVIKEDKTWFQPNSDKIATSGYSGKVKCYKDHICFIDMPSNYHIKNEYNFSFQNDSQGKWLKYYFNEGTDKHGLDYDYTIRTVCFKAIGK